MNMLAQAEGSNASIIDEIVATYMYDALQPSTSNVSEIVNTALEVCAGRREDYIQWLRDQDDERLRSQVVEEFVFSGKDMQIIMNYWRNSPDLWMNTESLEKLHRLEKEGKKQECQQLKKTNLERMCSIFWETKR